MQHKRFYIILDEEWPYRRTQMEKERKSTKHVHRHFKVISRSSTPYLPGPGAGQWIQFQNVAQNKTKNRIERDKLKCVILPFLPSHIFPVKPNKWMKREKHENLNTVPKIRKWINRRTNEKIWRRKLINLY